MMDEKIKICTIDFDYDDVKLLINQGFDVHNGSAGNTLKFESIYSSERCILDYSFPPNLHEFQVLIVNMINTEQKFFFRHEHEFDKINSNGVVKWIVQAPENIFDPRPIAFHYFHNKILEFGKKPSLLIVFADKYYEADYFPVIIKHGGERRGEKIKQSNYSFWEFSLKEPKTGTKSTVVTTNPKLKSLLEDFTKLTYYQTFHLKTVIDREKSISIQDPRFHNILEDSTGDIISYSYIFNELVLFVFPYFENIGEFTKRFMTEVAPEILPNLFTVLSTFSWLDDKKYWLPGHGELIEQKSQEITRHEQELKRIDKEIEANKNTYNFLHDLITETDEELVDAVLYILRWLGFDNARKMDEVSTSGVFEEDIQLSADEKILVIEVKGIRGTSKDSECSQIDKIKHRRMKQLKSFDVYGLYIVNHQRTQPSLNRQNPPFTDHQIQDALNTERGLMTTWSLYQLYWDIEAGIFTKEEARIKFFDFGLVDFRSKLETIGKVIRKFNEVTIGVELSGTEIKVGDEVLTEEDGFMAKYQVLSIHQNNVSVPSACEGETGIQLDKPMKKNVILYKKPQYVSRD
ncbi:hypothetical protein GCM10027275_11970 [Rhabdobacter roseus]|uniref:Uncharacterized protein n=1 Tax=Rhabdobacter roseus TaxID=1655419 RepID=A0A840TIF7_9BACT|nr:hypothetical protein [Rhabdobacter roseus]MBB5283111.1 hypothetical protein [Rhabdobacter roseus]